MALKASPWRQYPCCMAFTTRKIIGERIKTLRKANHLSQQKLTLMTSIERSYLSKIERGSRNYTLDCLERITGGLGVTLGDLLAGAEEEGLRVDEQEAPPIPKTDSQTRYFYSRLP